MFQTSILSNVFQFFFRYFLYLTGTKFILAPEHEIIQQVILASGRKYIHNLLIQIIYNYTDIITVVRLEGIHFIKGKTFRKLSSGDVNMPVKNINSRCSGYTVSSGDICECCIWRLEISENIEYSSNRAFLQR